jgi:hypothetical protein
MENQDVMTYNDQKNIRIKKLYDKYVKKLGFKTMDNVFTPIVIKTASQTTINYHPW